MGRAPCCDKASVKKGPWSPEEDAKLKSYIEQNGTGGNWIALPQKIGLKRCGKSCRLRWLNYLRPDIKHGGFSEEEENIICSLYVSIGSRWSIIASQLPGRTDNDIKNYWNTRLKKKLFGKQLRKENHTLRGNTTTNLGMKQQVMITNKANTITNIPFLDHNTININQITPYWPEITSYLDGQAPIRNFLFKLGDGEKQGMRNEGLNPYDKLSQVMPSSSSVDNIAGQFSCSQYDTDIGNSSLNIIQGPSDCQDIDQFGDEFLLGPSGYDGESDINAPWSCISSLCPPPPSSSSSASERYNSVIQQDFELGTELGYQGPEL